MPDSAATDTAPSDSEAKKERPAPKGYTEESFRCAQWDGKEYGLGVLTLGEPTFGRFRAFQNAANGRADHPEGQALRAFIKRADSKAFPGPDTKPEAAQAFFDDLPLGAATALIDVVGYFADRLAKALTPEGNG